MASSHVKRRPTSFLVCYIAFIFSNYIEIASGSLNTSSVTHDRTANLIACITRAFTPLGDAPKRIVTPSNDTYTDSRTGEKINTDEYPALIAYATSQTEVPLLLACAQQNSLKAVVRSGGHHFEAYSALTDTLVIDIAHINHVQVSADHQTAVVGAGTRLGSLYLALDGYNTSFVGGICPTVGIGGLIASGGFNMQMRALGLSVEYVECVKAVTASGQVITASKNSHSDLFWAMLGGGGGTYAIALEFTLKLTALPNSAMVYLNWQGYNDSTAFQVAKRFLDWAPRVDPAFTSSINVYKNEVAVGGWYLGRSQEELQSLIESSGLLEIGTPYLLNISISGNCNTDASRIFGSTGGIFTCTPVSPPIVFALNAAPDPFSAISGYPQYQYNETTSAPQVLTGPSWARFRRISKSFIMQKDNLIQDAALKEVVSRIESLDTDSQIVGEWHSWNISGTAAQPNAFAWREKAYAHLEFTIHGSADQVQNQVYVKWMNDLESYLRPQLGEASYTGYADSDLSTNHYSSYFGDNVCRLVQIKRTYDPTNFFTNPLAITPTVPAGIRC